MALNNIVYVMLSPVEMVSRVSVPFPDILLRQRGKAKYGTGQNKPLTSRRILIVLDSRGTAAADSKTEINPSVGNIAAVKCLSLNQPYAELLISGKKTIEVRRWNTNFRGQFLVHASKKINEETCPRRISSLNMIAVTTPAIIEAIIRIKSNVYLQL